MEGSLSTTALVMTYFDHILLLYRLGIEQLCPPLTVISVSPEPSVSGAMDVAALVVLQSAEGKEGATYAGPLAQAWRGISLRTCF
jgi:hypothetical protein